jgi:hypothetical protein
MVPMTDEHYITVFINFYNFMKMYDRIYVMDIGSNRPIMMKWLNENGPKFCNTFICAYDNIKNMQQNFHKKKI